MSEFEKETEGHGGFCPFCDQIRLLKTITDPLISKKDGKIVKIDICKDCFTDRSK